MDRFKDKIVIVTGAASGIGKALSELLAQRGAKLILADINFSGAKALEAALIKKGLSAKALLVDVSKEGDVRKAVKYAVSTCGRLDFVFNNSGIGFAGEVKDMDLSIWKKMIDVNLYGVIHGTTIAYSQMLKQGSGHIVNVASATGLIPSPMLTAYATTKHAIVGLSTSLREEAKEYGVKVSVACPGFVDTGILDPAKAANIDEKKLYREKRKLKMMSPEKCAKEIIIGVEKNREIIIFPFKDRMLWWLYRLNPYAIDSIENIILKRARKLRKTL
ncbi:MAG: SDR family NAD(P)-dependent oxidoreductase [archaeon]